MADDAGRLLVRIEATQAAFEKQMAAIAKAGAKAAGDVELKFKKANDNIRKGSPQAAEAIRKSSQAAGQLSFQLNDIATSLAGGASPFQVMMQQGSQVTQVFQQMGGGFKGAASVLAGAFSSMLNPISLVSFGLIAAAGYAIQYFTAVEKEGPTAREELDKQADAVEKLAKEYGDLFPELKRVADLRRAEADAAGETEAKEAALAAAYEDTQKVIDELVRSVVKMVSMLEALGVPAEEIAKLQTEYGALIVAVKEHTASSEDAKKVVAALDKVIAENAGTVKTLAEAIRKQLVSSFEELDRAAKSAGETIQRALDFQLPGAGGPMDMAPLVRAQGAAATAADSNTAAFIKREEAGRSFTPKAYWDSNAYRVGYGSDTYVDEMGKIQQVTKDTVVTLEQANLDLARRIGEFQRTIQSQIGPDMWRSLTEAQQTALTSIAYNYGRLPASIVEAIESGDQGKVALAIRNLSANKDRRGREAALYAGSGGAAGDTLAQADAYEKARENLAAYLETLDEQASLQQRINDINASGLSAEDKIRAIEVETELQKALNLAKQNGLTLTAQEIELIRQKALANAEAGIQSDEIKAAAQASADALKESQRSAEEFQKAVQGAVGGLIKDLIAGKDAAEAFGNALQKIADKALEMALNNLFSMGGPGAAGGMLGGMIIPGILHKGGVAGVHGYGSGRAVSASAFAGAKRYHSGGMIGAGEVPAILKRGEIVLPAGAARRGGGGTETVHVRLQDDSGRMAEIADRRIQTASGAIVKVSVVQATKTVARRMPGMMANAQVRSA